MTWALAKAKDNFSEIVDRALREGPQYVTRHGKDCVVILSREEFDRLEAGNGAARRCGNTRISRIGCSMRRSTCRNST